MSNCRQSVRPFPCTNQPYLLENGTNTVELEEILTQFQGPHHIKAKNTGNMPNKGTFWLFQDHLDSFQDPCLNLHKFNIFGSIWCISHKNKHQLLTFEFFNLLCPSRPIVAIYEQIWPSVKTHKKYGNFHFRCPHWVKISALYPLY